MPEITALFGGWQAKGLLEGRKAFIAGLQVERDSKKTSQVNVVFPPDVVNGLRIFAAKIEFRL